MCAGDGGGGGGVVVVVTVLASVIGELGATRRETWLAVTTC